MDPKKCERCGAYPRGMELLDYCGVCSKDLCPHCMAEGCCGNVPAVSGEELDNEDFEAAEHEMHPTPESLASSQAVSNADNFSSSDSESKPAQARVI